MVMSLINKNRFKLYYYSIYIVIKLYNNIIIYVANTLISKVISSSVLGKEKNKKVLLLD